ncbi:MAG TPA: ketopantoate reductase family protein, partial [Lachnospiraceae bacterium]|nr:ketopantoate reductase family protein [Lachnospiraceae bacterium]
ALRYTKPGRLQIGVTEGDQKPAFQALVSFLERTGIPYEICPDIRRSMWNKFMLNVGINQACTVYETDYAHATAPGPILDEMIGAMTEVIRIAEAEGIHLTQEDLNRCVELEKTLKPDGYPSMRQDAVAKRPTEVDMFAGTVIQLGEKHGIPTPVNRKYMEAVRRMEERWG